VEKCNGDDGRPTGKESERERGGRGKKRFKELWMVIADSSPFSFLRHRLRQRSRRSVSLDDPRQPGPVLVRRRQRLRGGGYLRQERESLQSMKGFPLAHPRRICSALPGFRPRGPSLRPKYSSFSLLLHISAPAAPGGNERPPSPARDPRCRRHVDLAVLGLRHHPRLHHQPDLLPVQSSSETVHFPLGAGGRNPPGARVASDQAAVDAPLGVAGVCVIVVVFAALLVFR
jgi:hypothetical protein